MCAVKLPRKFAEENRVISTLLKQMELGIFRITIQISYLPLFKYLSTT